MTGGYPIFAKRDLDGFFGLAIDNLVQLLLILTLCGTLCGMSGANDYYLYRHILPGAAVSLLIGNLFYAMQAHWVARRERRADVTALPYGINTVSLLVYVFFVMKPTYDRNLGSLGPAGAVHLAWMMGLIACLGSGILEFAGAFFAERLRRNTPRAALLSTLAGIAITFISMTFALQIWQRPLVAMVPMAIVLMVYFSHVRFPLGIPGGFVAVLLGTALAWGLGALGVHTGVVQSADPLVTPAAGRRHVGAMDPAGRVGALHDVVVAVTIAARRGHHETRARKGLSMDAVLEERGHVANGDVASFDDLRIPVAARAGRRELEVVRS